MPLDCENEFPQARIIHENVNLPKKRTRFPASHNCTF